MAEDANRAWKDQYLLRMPDGLRDRIKRAAEANNRSMNAEIVAALTEKYPPPAVDMEEEAQLAWIAYTAYTGDDEEERRRRFTVMSDAIAESVRTGVFPWPPEKVDVPDWWPRKNRPTP